MTKPPAWSSVSNPEWVATAAARFGLKFKIEEDQFADDGGIASFRNKSGSLVRVAVRLDKPKAGTPSNILQKLERLQKQDEDDAMSMIDTGWQDMDGRTVPVQLSKAYTHPTFGTFLRGNKTTGEATFGNVEGGGEVELSAELLTTVTEALVKSGTITSERAVLAVGGSVPKPWTSEDAATLILREIERAGSPDEVRAAASHWLVKLTNAISDISNATYDI